MKLPAWLISFGTLSLFVAAESLQVDDASSDNHDHSDSKQHWHLKGPTSTSKREDNQDTKEALADQIHVLPGWTKTIPSRMFSGYVDAGTSEENGTHYTMHEHYFFVESEGDPMRDPLIIWTNGGPGASSMFGLFVELGPFYLSGDSFFTPYAEETGIPELFRNEHSWSKLANLLIINSPPPIGYSYCDPVGPTGDGYSCGTWNDTKTAYHNRIYLESFFERFPKFKNSDIYVIGESYAGVYVPTLVREILDQTEDSDNAAMDGQKWMIKNSLKGFAVGDACMGTKNVCGKDGPGPLLNLEFMRGHGQFSEKLYRDVFKKCSMEDLIGFREGDGNNFDYFNGGITDKTCLDHLKKIENATGPYYIYHLYDACWYQNDLEPPHNSLTQKRDYFSSVPPFHNKVAEDSKKPDKLTATRGARHGQRTTPVSSTGKLSLSGAVNDYPCGGNAAFFEWVMKPQVKQALHVEHGAIFFSGDNGVGFTYNTTEPDLMPFYYRVVTETDLRVLVYNGDADPAINSFTAQNWTSHLGVEEIEPWRPWTIDGKEYIGGYVTRYENKFDFLSIRAAGHMVPQYKPKVTFEFLERWLNNEPWKEWRGGNDNE